MSGNNKLSRSKAARILTCFCLDIVASKTAVLAGVIRNTVSAHHRKVRTRIYAQQIAERETFAGEVEMDERFFGPSRRRGQTGRLKSGRGTQKQAVFGLYERGGRVYAKIAPDCSKRALHSVILGHIDPLSIVYSDDWRGYDRLVHVGFDRHIRINKKKTGFARGRTHLNGIEAFWSFTKRRLATFNGVRSTFALHLKECEWRYKKDHVQQEKELRVRTHSQ